MTDDKLIEQKFKTFIMPYQMGVFLGINAISDAALVVDGPNCSIPKADFIYGNHDINSNLFSHYGNHRLFYTMSKPLKQTGNPENRLEVLLSSLSNSGMYGAVFITALPFQKLAGMDYDGIASSINGKAPVAEIQAKSLEADWLEGYAQTLSAAASCLVKSKSKLKKDTVALVGYFMDRNEADNISNIKELEHLLSLCGLDLVCVFPSAKNFDDLKNVLSAETVISFPYGRKAAKSISSLTGAKLIETDIPIGINKTTEWIKSICDITKKKLPEQIIIEEKCAKNEIRKTQSILMHKPALFAGDPFLFEAIYDFSKELGMRLNSAFLDCFPRKLKYLHENIFFSPTTEQVKKHISGLSDFDTPFVLIGNSFAKSENFAENTPFVEIGFPSYSHHCFIDEPFIGYKGAINLACRLLNSQMKLQRQ